MNNKKWFYLLISILCIATIIGSYIYAYKPYAEKKLLRDNYNAIVSVYSNIKHYAPLKEEEQNSKVAPLLKENSKLKAIKKNLYESTGKLTEKDNKIALALLLQSVNDLEEMIKSRMRGILFNDTNDETMFKDMDAKIKFEEITLPKIKGYVE